MSSGITSQHVLPTSESISMPTELPSMLTGPPDPASTSSPSSRTSSETQSPFQQSTQPSNPAALPTLQCTLSSLGADPSLKSPGQTSASTSATPFDIPSSVQDTWPTYNGSGTSTVEPKSPSPSSLSLMSASTKGSPPGGGISTPSLTADPGGAPSQNSPPTFGPTTSDIDPSLSIPSGVSPSPPNNGPGSAPSIVTSVPLQSPTKPPVTSMPPVLPGQQTPGQSPSLTTLSTPGSFITTASTTIYITPTKPVSTDSSISSSPSTSADSATSTSSQHNDPSQSIPTSMTSSSQSVSSSIVSSTNTPNSVKSSAITSSSTDSITYTSPSFNSRTTTSAPTSMISSSSQEGLISSVSSSNIQNPAKTSTTTSNSSVPTSSPTSTSESSKQNDPQTTAVTSTLTSSSQEGSISSVLSSTFFQTTTQNPAKSSTATSSTSVPTDPTAPNSSKQNPQTTALTSAPISTTTSHEGSITPTSSVEALSSSPSSTENSPPTSSSDKVHTATSSSSTTTVSDTNTPNSQSSGENTAYTPSLTLNVITSATNSPGGSDTSQAVQPSDDPAVAIVLSSGSTTFVVHGSSIVGTPENVIVSTMSTSKGESLSYYTTTSTSFSYLTSIGASSTSVETFTFPTTFTASTLIPTSGTTTRSNEAAAIGGAVGGVLALLVLSVAACCFIRRRRRSHYHQQLHDNDLTAPLSPEAIETMRETHPYSPTYGLVGRQVMSESQDDMHRASGSFVSASSFPRPAALHFTSEFHTRNSSGSVFYEDITVSNDGYASSGEGSESTERDFASAQSLYSSDGRESSERVGLGIAVGSESSTDLNSFCTAATTLAPLSRIHADNDEEPESPGPSPSSFPAPPGSNPFLDMARNTEFEASRVLHGMDAVSAAWESAALTPTKFRAQQESWTAAVAAASTTDAETPKATRSFNPFTEESYIIDVSSDRSSEDIEVPARPFNNSSVIDIVNPFTRKTSQEGLSDDSGSSESHETVSIPYAYSDPFEFKDKGKGKAHLSADLMDDAQRNRLSNASSGLEFPENASQCGIAL